MESQARHRAENEIEKTKKKEIAIKKKKKKLMKSRKKNVNQLVDQLFDFSL